MKEENEQFIKSVKGLKKDKNDLQSTPVKFSPTVKNKEVPIDRFNHYLDAIRYAMMFLLQGLNSGKYTIR